MVKDLTALYANRCPVCGGIKSYNLAALSAGPYDDFLDDIAEKLFKQQVNDGYIPPALYRQTAQDIFKAVTDGLGGMQFGYDDEKNILKAYLQQNIYAFSAAKSLTELAYFRDLLAQAGGDFIKFRNSLTDAGYKFNVNWLATEADTANATALSAHNWDELSSNSEYVQYTTAHDDRVRPAHAALDGLTFSINSPVLHSLWPPIDWNCRCHMIPGVAAKVVSDAVGGKLAKQALTNPLFAFNPGISKIVYDNGHPYFEALGKFKELEAEKNYGLPSLDKLYAQNSFPIIPKLESESAYLQWWEAQPKIKGTDNICIVDKLGNSLVFDSAKTTGDNRTANYFKDHAVRKENEKRYQYAANFAGIVKNPDEVYAQKDQSGRLTITYIKYFDDGPYAVIVNDKKDMLVGETIYKLTKARGVEMRRGILLYAKK